jgi:predicted small lipoprotein YifL
VILIVKSPFALPAAGFALAALLSACGQPGPLYMPKPPVRGAASAPAAPQATPVPVNTASPPAPAAGVTPPSAASNANNTQAPQSSSPATQQ